MWRSLVAVMVLALASEARAALSDFAGYTYTDSQGYTLPYRLFTPLNYNPQQKYPLILMLHGAGESGTDNVAPASHLSSTRIVDRAKTAEYASFVLVPQTNSGWSFTGDGSLSTTLSLMDGLEHQYSIDTRREYVTGLSMGGYGTWAMLELAPTRFAAAAPVAGYGDPTWCSDFVNVPIWAYASTADTVVPAYYTQQMIDVLQADGGTPRYTEFPFDQHGDTLWNDAYSEPQLYQWMFSQVNSVATVPEPASLGALGLVLGLGLLRGLNR